MLLEYWNYIAEPSSTFSRKYGYHQESIAYKFRSNRCFASWTSHRNHCHPIIKNTVENFLFHHCPSQEHQKTSCFEEIIEIGTKDGAFPHSINIVILGSSYLFEVPIESLINLSEISSIYLVDVVHPRRVRSLQKKHLNKIHLIDKDISGLPQPLESMTPEQIHQIHFPSFSKELEDKLKSHSKTLIISSNIWSQLSYIPMRFLAQKKRWKAKDLEDLNFRIQENHLNWIQSLSRYYLIISDFERVFVSKNNSIIQQEPTIHPSLLPKMRATWKWDIAPIGEISRDFSMELKVFYSYSKEAYE